MTTAAPSTVQTSVTINRVLPATGRDNVEQWELHVRWPWTPAANQYGDKVWVNQGDFPMLSAVTKGYFPHCEVVKGTLKGKADGTRHDGSQNWMWNWRLLSLNGADAPTAGGQPSATQPESTHQTPETPQDAIQERIERGMAFNAAVALLTPTAKVSESNISQGLLDTRWLRDRLYHEVIRVPVAPLHYCYTHETPRIQNPKSSNWAHQLPNNTWCIEPPAAPTATVEDREE